VDERKELSSAEARYFKNCDPKNYRASDEGWKVWLVVMQAWTHKTIQSQEVVPAPTALFSEPVQNRQVSINH
jgi:hypothetical protein